MPWQASPAFFAQIDTPNYTAIQRLWVCDGFGHRLYDLTPHVTSASVSVDESRAQRRQLTFTVMSDGTDGLVPVVAGDLLHPVTGNEIRAYRGVILPDNSEEFAPLGIFRMTKPTISDDTVGGGIKIDMTCGDRSQTIAQAVWPSAYRIKAGSQCVTVLQDAIHFIAPWLDVPFKFTPSNYVTNRMVWGHHRTGAQDPWSDFSKMASSMGMELFFDVLGRPVLQPVQNVWELVDIDSPLIEGANCQATQASRVLDETKTFNGVILRCHGSAGHPLTVTVWDNDPNSPTYYQGPWGPRPLIFDDSHIPAMGESYQQAAQHARVAALAMFSKVCRAFDEPQVQCVPNPALQESDSLQFTWSRMGIDDRYTISTMTIPLDIAQQGATTGAPMSLGFRNQREVVTT